MAMAEQQQQWNYGTNAAANWNITRSGKCIFALEGLK
jgi:hypothetical protein